MKRLINLTPPPASKLFLGLLPFALLLLLYVVASDARLAENANDKLLPAFSQMGEAIDRMALEPSKRTGEYLFWQDTASSLKRLGLGVLPNGSVVVAIVEDLHDLGHVFARRRDRFLARRRCSRHWETWKER